jgi:alpha-glucosidase (family GH31 glycosyl hydrolase)
MDKGRDFTIDPVKFFGLMRFVHSLHERGMHYMIITDPGISAVEEAGSYPPYDDGVAMDCFIKNSSGGLLEGQVWTGDRTVFPDFTHPNATEYWTKQIVDFHGQIGFDGLWIDMVFFPFFLILLEKLYNFLFTNIISIYYKQFLKMLKYVKMIIFSRTSVNFCIIISVCH